MVGDVLNMNIYSLASVWVGVIGLKESELFGRGTKIALTLCGTKLGNMWIVLDDKLLSSPNISGHDDQLFQTNICPYLVYACRVRMWHSVAIYGQKVVIIIDVRIFSKTFLFVQLELLN